MLTRLILLFAAIGAIAGCARSPAGQGQTARNELQVEITFAAPLKLQGIDSYFYFFALNTDGDLSNGPVPVRDQPWGNGWGTRSKGSTGGITYFLRVDASQFQFYKIPGDDLTQFSEFRQPLIRYSSPQGTNKLIFTLDVDALGLPPTRDRITFNIIASDVVPLDPNYGGGKRVDALGSTGNDFVGINILQNGEYTNDSLGQLEESEDVLPPGTDDKSLDIVDWKIRVVRG